MPQHGTPAAKISTIAVQTALLLLLASATLAQEKPAPSPPNGAPGNTANPPSVPTVTISAIQPAIPFSIPNQTLTLTGNNFQTGLATTLEGPLGNSISLPQDQIVSIEATKIVLTATLDSPGQWKIKVTNPKASPSSPLKFSVVAYPAINPPQAAVNSYQYSFWVTTGALLLLFLGIAVGLGIYMGKSQWSLGDALSEESSMQPKEIHSRKDVIMVASSSRLIALLGLLGILSVVLGVGFAISWNLFIYGTVPQLAQVRSFLFGAACLFAPYLANQVRSAFDSPGTTAPEPSTSAAEAIAITGISPSRPSAQPTSQVIRITGNGFREHPTVSFTQPDSTNLAPTSIDSVDATLILCHATLATAGNWKVSVTNEGGNPFPAAAFTVVGKPTITGIDPPNIASALAARPISFAGSGFMSDLTVSLRRPDASVHPVPAADLTITSTRVVVSAVINVAGNWAAIITNPGTNAVEHAFTVTQ
jgi:IPT/TIG domain-containing protein